jgi:hypothetical protein
VSERVLFLDQLRFRSREVTRAFRSVRREAARQPQHRLSDPEDRALEPAPLPDGVRGVD